MLLSGNVGVRGACLSHSLAGALRDSESCVQYGRARWSCRDRSAAIVDGPTTRISGAAGDGGNAAPRRGAAGNRNDAAQRGATGDGNNAAKRNEAGDGNNAA